ncbi:MAG: GNAT family N-acetyltransferase [Deltaproteobacteria bacterium]|nr:GNAT family N-acetyltransferase [Deltaproteobacteria bacterium]
MERETLYAIEWPGEGDEGETLRVIEPTPDEVETAAARLAAFYNEPYNRGMMANEGEMTARDVVDYYREFRASGGRPFLLERDGVLMGDADLRHIDGPTAEFAILVGVRAAQGSGLGTRFALMVHALASGALGIERMYSSVIPLNRPSLRMLEKIGYLPDDGPEARARADEATDVTVSFDFARFAELHAAVLPRLRITGRGATPPPRRVNGDPPLVADGNPPAPRER